MGNETRMEVRVGEVTHAAEGAVTPLSVLSKYVPDADAEARWREAELRRMDAARWAFAVDAGIPQYVIDLYRAGRWERTDDFERVLTAIRSGRQLVLLHGPLGTGKSVAAAAILLEPANVGLEGPRFVGRWVHAADYAAWARDRDSAWRADDVSRSLYLVVDDAGDEPVKDRPHVARLIGRRYDSRRVTIITTNMTGHEFKDAYGQRIADRVREAGVSRGFTERRRK